MRSPRARPPIVAISGPSGAGKTRLIARLIPALVRRGVAVAVLKHTRHRHALDRRGKDTDVFRRAGAVAAAIEGPDGMAWFGPPAGGLRALARRLPPVDLVLAEGFRGSPVPRVEVHRRRVSAEFLCATDRRVFAIVTDEPPPRPVAAFAAGEVDPLAAALCSRFGVGVESRGRASLRVRPVMSRVRADPGERTALGRPDRMAKMAKTTNRRGGARGGARRGSSARRGGGRSAAGRKGGNATLRTRGPEFYSEIGRKGGKRRASRARAASSRTGRGSRSGGSRAGGRRSGGSRSSRRSSSR